MSKQCDESIVLNKNRKRRRCVAENISVAAMPKTTPKTVDLSSNDSENNSNDGNIIPSNAIPRTASISYTPANAITSMAAIDASANACFGAHAHLATSIAPNDNKNNTGKDGLTLDSAIDIDLNSDQAIPIVGGDNDTNAKCSACINPNAPAPTNGRISRDVIDLSNDAEFINNVMESAKLMTEPKNSQKSKVVPQIIAEHFDSEVEYCIGKETSLQQFNLQTWHKLVGDKECLLCSTPYSFAGTLYATRDGLTDLADTHLYAAKKSDEECTVKNTHLDHYPVLCQATSGCHSYHMCRMCLYKQFLFATPRKDEHTGEIFFPDPTKCPQCKQSDAFLERDYLLLSSEARQSVKDEAQEAAQSLEQKKKEEREARRKEKLQNRLLRERNRDGNQRRSKRLEVKQMIEDQNLDCDDC